MEFYSDLMNGRLLKKFVNEHRRKRAEFDKLDRYYRGEHDILNRRRSGEYSPNNRIVCNFAKYITDTAIGYTFGNPVKIRFSGCDDETSGNILKESMYSAGTYIHDAELAKDLSVFGVGFELVYVDNDGNVGVALIDPRKAFVVRGEEFEEPVKYAVIYETAENCGKFRVFSCDTVDVYQEDGKGGEFVKVSTSPNLLGKIPLVDYYNNEEGMGDFEHVMTLIDAYNTLQSDRVNDKERFVDSVLLIQGCQFPDEESAAKMLTNRILQLPFDNADAKYLTKTMNEAETEILRRAIASDIHKFSQTPDFSDEHFSGNSSGVAIKYKLLSIENLAKIKERFFTEGLIRRVAIFDTILRLLGKIDGEIGKANVYFDRTLPVNELETAEIIGKLNGIVPQEELIDRWRR